MLGLQRPILELDFMLVVTLITQDIAVMEENLGCSGASVQHAFPRSECSSRLIS